MAEETRALQAREKQEVAAPAEQTVPGPIFTPAVDILETDREMLILADLPGVKVEDLRIDLRDNVLTLIGDVNRPEDAEEVDVFREYQTGRYVRQFTLSQVIDQGKIDANLKDGVLSLRLPKVEAATPRKITIST